MDEHFRPIAQIVEKPDGFGLLNQFRTLGIKWEWRGGWFGFWGVVQDREQALINVATTFYRSIRRQQREDHWYWRVLYWMGNCIRWFVADPAPGIELEEAAEAAQHF